MKRKNNSRLTRCLAVILLALSTALFSSCENLMGWPSYTVIYEANGGTGNMSNSRHWHGVSQELSANAFTRANFNFGGWARAPGDVPAFANRARVVNLTEENGGVVRLYAVWLPRFYNRGFKER